MLRRATPERLSAFSDGVFAVLITVLVLELRPPAQPTFAALLALWPTWLSYAVSYLFIAIVWANHHYLIRYAGEATPRLLWFNFAHLFSMSLLPLSTAWMAVSELAPAAGLVLCGRLLPGERNLHRPDLGIDRSGSARKDPAEGAPDYARAVADHALLFWAGRDRRVEIPACRPRALYLLPDRLPPARAAGHRVVGA